MLIINEEKLRIKRKKLILNKEIERNTIKIVINL